jgi:hypothetical protein
MKVEGAIARHAGSDARSRGAALALTAKTFEYNIAVTSAMADVYVEVVQGDLADLDCARRGLLELIAATRLLADGVSPGG